VQHGLKTRDTISAVQVTVRLFAVLRERAATDQLQLDLPPGTSVRGASESIAEKLPTLRDLLARVAFAVNREYVKPDAILNDGDELALIPPVSGG